MSKMMNINYTEKQLKEINAFLKRKTPEEVVSWVIDKAKRPIVTTNFRPYEGAILYLITSIKKEMKVIWCDTGYNTIQTYKHAEELIKKLNLNIHTYVPKQTSSHRDAVMGIPKIGTPMHKIFTEQVKLEPFRRAITEHQPDFWFTNLRKGQTTFRDNIDIIYQDKSGVLKVSPFYNFTDEQLDAYNKKNGISNEFKYFDPTKVLKNRECGIHT